MFYTPDFSKHRAVGEQDDKPLNLLGFQKHAGSEEPAIGIIMKLAAHQIDGMGNFYGSLILDTILAMTTPITTAKEAHRQFMLLAQPERATLLQRYFKTGPGEYAEGDVFLGLNVPTVRSFAKRCESLSLSDIAKLIASPYHEERLLALLLMVRRYAKGDAAEKQAAYDCYVASFPHINNWDLVDTSAPYIVGPHLQGRSRKILLTWARSKNLWERRIAVLATAHYIRQGDYADTLALAELLLSDKEDLIHKAVGWMLREIGGRDPKAEEAFLDRFADCMPRTMLRYAVEKFSPAKRKHYLSAKERAGS